MSGFKPQSLQTLTTPSLSWQQGLTSNPSTALLGPSSIPHLSPNTPSGNSPQFNPYHTTLETPTPTPNNCYNRFPQIQGGGPKEPDLAQLLGWALSHWVSDSLTDIFMGVLKMRF